MSKMKKIASVLLAVVMVLALNVTVLAADTYTITINYSESGHTYEAYQIFSGTLSEYAEYTGTTAPTDETQLYTYDSSTGTYTAATYDGTSGATYYYYTGKVLSDIQWGSGVDGDALLAALTDDTYTYYSDFKDCATAADVAAVLSANNTSTALAESFAQLASENLSSTVAGTSTETASPYTITGLSAGYYLVKDEDGSVTAEGDSYTDIILEVVADVTVDAKADTTTVDKKVDSSTDSDNETTADYDIGDDVPFTLTATLPSNYASYSEYKLTFHDTLSDGLKFNDSSVVVTVVDGSNNKTVVVTGYTLDTSPTCYSVANITEFASGVTYYTYDGNSYTVVASTDTYDSTTTYYVKCSFEVQIADTNALYDSNGDLISVDKDCKIVVTYTAELLDSAVTTETNTAYTEYSNNPNDNGTGTTPKDITTVFTFTLDVDKVDGDGNALSGAGFTLYKAETVSITEFASGTTYYTIDDSTGKVTAVAEGTTFDSTETYYVYTAVDTVTGGTTFEFKGLGVGYYKLVESTTPTGYNTMEDMYFTIVAVTKEDTSGNAYVDSLTIKASDGTVISADDDSEPFTISTTAQTISTDIENHKGSTLPTTGGIGTTIFYVVGGVMVVGALTLLITRLRMRKRKSI